MLDNEALGAASFTLLATFRVANQVSVFIDVEHHHLHICQKLPLYMPMGCCQGLHHPIIISNQHPNTLNIHSLPLSCCCYCKKQPICKKNRNNPFGRKKQQPIGISMDFFLSFSGAGILSRGLKPVEDWGRRRRRRTTALPADFHRV
jgi:hypothetical protein